MHESNISKKQSFDDDYQEANICWSPQQESSKEAMRFYVGDQYSESERDYLRKEKRTAFVYNKVKRTVDNAVGYQIKNRLGLACEPVEGADIETCDIFSDLLTWNMAQQNGYNKFTQGFKGACITGLNLMSLYMDYTTDKVDGDVMITKEPNNAFLLDPLWNGDASLDDCRYILRRRYVSRERAASILPDMKKDILRINSSASNDKFTFMNVSQKILDGTVAIDEHWKKDTVNAKLIVNRISGETKVFKGTKRALNAFLDSPVTIPMPNGFEITIPWREMVDVTDTITNEIVLRTFVNGILMDEKKEVFGLDSYPFVPIIGYYMPEHYNYADKLQGIPHCIIDSQKDYNRQRSKVLDMMNSQAATGFFYKEGSVKNPLDLFKTGQGVNIVLDQDAAPGDVQPITPRDIPTNWMNYIAIADADIPQISGVTNENLGMQDLGSQVSGTAIKLRMSSGTTTLAELYDNADVSLKVIGQKQIKMMQQNWSPQKVERIIGRPPTQEFYKKNFGKYDAIVKETNLTDSQRNLAWIDALQARAVLGDVIPNEFMIEMYPGAEKSKLLKAFAAQDEQKKAQAAKVEEREDITKRLANAEVISKLSLASERRARMAADIGLAKNRMADAFQDRTNAVLNQAKTITELQGVRQNQLESAIRLVFELEERAQEQTKFQTDDTLNRSLEEVAVTDEIANPPNREPFNLPPGLEGLGLGGQDGL